MAAALPDVTPITVTEHEPFKRVQVLGEKATLPVSAETADQVTEPLGVWPPSATVAVQVVLSPTVMA